MAKNCGVIAEGKPGLRKRKQTPCSLLCAVRGRRLPLTIQRTRTPAASQRCSSAKILGGLMNSAGPEDPGGWMPSSSSSSSSGERCRRRRLQRGHRDSPEPTVTATAPFLNRCLTRGYGPLQGSAKHCRPYDPRVETVATPWTPQTGGATVAPPSWYHMTRGVGAA